MNYVELFSSYLISECDQRAFVLKAVGIEHVVAQLDNRYAVLVPEEFAAAALEHLDKYAEESRPIPQPPPLQLHGKAWIGSVVYLVVMLAVAYFAGARVSGFDWYGAGFLSNGVITNGEWWRVFTALTLHADVGHLIGNLAFGIPYGYFASQLLGGGRAWLSILVAAVLGNLIDSALMPVDQRSIGASTAVFAMLGLVGAYAWRQGHGRFNRWAHRWAPLVGAVALLALTGVGGERTDIVAHLAGFACGAAIGAVQPHIAKRFDHRGYQWLLGAIAFLTVVAAWGRALLIA